MTGPLQAVRRSFQAAILLLAATSLPCIAADRTAAEHALNQGRADEAIRMLREITTASPADGAAHLLLCRAFLSEELADDAVRECEAALANGLARDSRAQDWMGRSYGKKADMSGPLTGLKVAHKVKDSFEAAVDLDPRNADAVDDLGEFYTAAPAMVGGGLDRARALADRLNGPLPDRAQRLRGLIAEKQKDYGTAEREFRALAEAKPTRPDGWVDLASYYQRTKNSQKAVEAVRRGIEVNRKRDPSLYAAALVLIKLRQEPALAEQALRSYLTGNALEDGAPAFQAHYQLGRLLQAAGNTAGAKAEFQASLGLASGYAAARKALQAL